jgi:type I restriction enzyme M protein
MNDYIKYGIEQGLFSFDDEETRISYKHQNQVYPYSIGSEEETRAITYVELIKDYGYKPKNIRFQIPVQLGQNAHFVDISIYHDSKSNQAGKVFAIIELKKGDTTDSQDKIRKQARSYAHSDEFKRFSYYAYRIGYLDPFVVFDENDKKVAHIPYDYNNQIIYAYITEGKAVLPPPPHYQKLKASTSHDLRQIFKSCHDIIWDGGSKSQEDAFNEFAKLLFLKMYDEIEHEEKHCVPYIFQLNQSETASALASRIKKEYKNVIIQRKVEGLLTPLNINSYQLERIVEKLQAISLIETDNDPKGLAYETFVKAYMKGEFGQYFTPRNIVEFMIETSPIVWDDANFSNTSKVIDPCCGSGSFLIHAISEFKRQHPKARYWQYFANNSVFGIEKRDKTAVIAKINIALHDDGHDNIEEADGLNGHKFLPAGTFDLILTNPPFGVKIPNRKLPQDEHEKEELLKDKKQFFGYEEYDITTNRPDEIDVIRGKAKDPDEKQDENSNAYLNRKYGSQIDSETIFFEQYHKLLREEGIAQVVVPDGLLSNSSAQSVRDWIMTHFQILAVISLPDFTFKKYDAGVKTSIIFLKKHNYVTTYNIKTAKHKYLKVAVEEHEQDLAKLEAQYKDLPNQYFAIQELTRDLAEEINKMPTSLDSKAKKQHLKVVEIHYKALSKKIEDAPEYKAWIKANRDDLNQQINAIKATIYDIASGQFNKYEKQYNYPIFMAIAEHIGYEATGREIDKNDLPEIAEKLKSFLKTIIENPNAVFQ